MATRDTITANTAGTMSTERADRRLHRVAVTAALLAGGFLMIAAWPRIAAHGVLLQAGSAIRAIDEGGVLAPQAAETTFDAYSRALVWRPDDPALLRNRARLAGRLALLEPQSEGLWRARAVADFRAALAAAPGDGTAWARLAQAELEAGAEIEDVLPHLRLARFTSPRRASALLPQLSIAMRHWEAIPDDIRVHALADLPAFWQRRALRPLLVTAYLDAGLAARVAFRARLGENERALRDLDRLLASGLGG